MPEDHSGAFLAGAIAFGALYFAIWLGDRGYNVLSIMLGFWYLWIIPLALLLRLIFW